MIDIMISTALSDGMDRAEYKDAAKSGHTKRWKPVLTAVVSAAAVFAAVYVGGCFFFSSHYFPNTYINGTDHSMNTPADADAIFDEAAKERTVSVLFRGGDKLSIKGSDIGLSLSDRKVFYDTLDNQDPRMWPASVAGRQDVIVKNTYTFNEESLKSILFSAGPMLDENMTPPEDAFIDYSDEEEKFVIVPEKEGSVIDKEKAVGAVSSAVSSGAVTVDLSLVDGMYEEPQVLSSSEELASRADSLNTAVSGGIVYTLPDGETMSVDSSLLREWIGNDEDGYYIDDDAWYDGATVFVDEVAARCNSVWEEREFDSTEDGVVTVPGGTYGYVVDKEAEIDAILALKESSETDEREPVYSSVESADRSNHGIGGTYIEVSIDRQHLWYYEDGELVMDSPVVTGNAGRSETPRGQYRVQFTQRDAVLIGRPDANGNPSYRSPVDYWMPFYDGCGFHDASWRGSFGGDIYKYNGSHGCVNMPPSSARELFGYIEGKTPVVVIY